MMFAQIAGTQGRVVAILSGAMCVITDSTEPLQTVALPVMNEDEARKVAELMAAGYSVEDMFNEGGLEWEGKFRWVNNTVECWGTPQPSVHASWKEAIEADRIDRLANQRKEAA